MSVGQELLDVPFPLMIKNMGIAIANAQMEIDLVSIRLAQVMAGQDVKDEKGMVKIPAQLVQFDGKNVSLLELGFTPTFYQFVDTIIEVKMSVSMKTSFESSYSTTTYDGNFEGIFFGFYNKGQIHGTTVSASYASKYQYSSEGASLLRTKLVPVPAPAILQERIRRVVEREVAARPA